MLFKINHRPKVKQNSLEVMGKIFSPIFQTYKNQSKFKKKIWGLIFQFTDSFFLSFFSKVKAFGKRMLFSKCIC